MKLGITGVVTALKTLTLGAGTLITYYAHQAYRRTGDPALRALAAGFGTITIGSLFAGIMDQILPVERRAALLVETVFTLVGFGIVLYSLFMTVPTSQSNRNEESASSGSRIREHL